MDVFGIHFSAMACPCEIRIAARDEASAQALAKCAIDEVRRLESKYSRYRDDSIVARINAAAGQASVDVDDETAGLIEFARRLYAQSDGLFDITSGVLRRVWDFKTARMPAPDQIERVRALVGLEHTHWDGRRFGLARAGMEIDFGGFGKEYAVDRAATLLADRGVQSGFVDLGGDVRAIGPCPDGTPWRFAIRHPRDPSRTIASVAILHGALTTSGDYERYFDLAGKRYCHILDPRTGWPVAHWQSASVIAPMAIAAGGCSTIAMLKQTAGEDFLRAQGVGYLLVAPDGSLRHGDVPMACEVN